MAIYSVHNRPGKSAADAVFVREGFAWPAFLFTVLWCLWHRMWLTAAIVFAVLAAISIAAGLLGLNETLTSVFTLAASLVFGFEARDLQRRTLAATGYREVRLVSGGSLDDAELRYFASVPRAGALGEGFAPKLRSPESHDPLGLFGTA